MRSNVRDQRRRALGAPLADCNPSAPVPVPASGVPTRDDRCIALLGVCAVIVGFPFKVYRACCGQNARQVRLAVVGQSKKYSGVAGRNHASGPPHRFHAHRCSLRDTRATQLRPSPGKNMRRQFLLVLQLASWHDSRKQTPNVREQRRRALGAPLADQVLSAPVPVPASGVPTCDDRCIA